ILIVTGENTNQALQAVGMEITEAELARRALRKMGVDSTVIEVVERGTSTFEESDEILGIAQTRGFSRIMVITSKFHTRRVRNVFRDKFREAGIEIVLRGAEPLEYDIDKWWESESAMIFVNNEYVKAVYYWLKY
ncbi:MAG: YdcF family protein, partial [Bacteroidetes bacterium]|nr:YdcF family protein [Bacteroidota bacterium]